MSEFVRPIVESPLPVAQPRQLINPTRQRWFEVSLVLLVAVVPAVLSAFYILKGGPRIAPPIFNAKWLAGLGQEITRPLLLWYVLSRRNLLLKDLGVRVAP